MSDDGLVCYIEGQAFVLCGLTQEASYGDILYYSPQ